MVATYVQAAGLVDVLDTTSSEITVFAPTDDAFAALADALHLTPEELLAESNLLSVVRVRSDFCIWTAVDQES